MPLGFGAVQYFRGNPYIGSTTVLFHIVFHFQPCLAHYIALQIKNSTRWNFSISNQPACLENTDNNSLLA